jgi:hypothetical protein
MLFDLFILGSIPFMIFCSLFFIALCFEAHSEHLGVSIVTVVAFILLMGLCSELLTYSYRMISENLSLAIAIAVLYFPVGLLWSIFKWVLYLKDEIKRETGYYNRSDKKGKLGVPISLSYYLKAELPTVKNSKEKLVYWITYWPFSVIDFLLSDLIIRIGNLIYDLSGKMYDKIRDSLIPKEWKDK